MRIDKYLWCVRLCKTRSLATKLCTSDKVTMGGQPVKPARELTPGDEFSLRQSPVWRTFKVKDIPKSRVSAKLVELYMTETTDPAELLRLEEVSLANAENRLRGITGRPTKRDRRNMDRFKDI